MTNKETVERNIGLTFDFVNHLIETPEVASSLPAHFKIEFVEKDFPKLERKGVESQKDEPQKKFVRVRNSFELTK